MSGDRSGKQPRSSTIHRPENEVPSAFREVEFHRITQRTCQIFVGGGANALRTLDVRDLSEHQLLGDVYTRPSPPSIPSCFSSLTYGLRTVIGPESVS